MSDPCSVWGKNPKMSSTGHQRHLIKYVKSSRGCLSENVNAQMQLNEREDLVHQLLKPPLLALETDSHQSMRLRFTHNISLVELVNFLVGSLGLVVGLDRRDRAAG
jgi:hypothetical protein